MKFRFSSDQFQRFSGNYKKRCVCAPRRSLTISAVTIERLGSFSRTFITNGATCTSASKSRSHRSHLSREFADHKARRRSSSFMTLGQDGSAIRCHSRQQSPFSQQPRSRLVDKVPMRNFTRKRRSVQQKKLLTSMRQQHRRRRAHRDPTTSASGAPRFQTRVVPHGPRC
jgi:hypothetical protein